MSRGRGRGERYAYADADADTIPEMAPSTEREGGSPAKRERIGTGKIQRSLGENSPS